MKFVEGSSAITIRINFKQDVKNGKLILKPKAPQSTSGSVNVIFDSSNPNLTFEEPIEIVVPETNSVSM